MRLARRRTPAAPERAETAATAKPPWQHLLDDEERPSREDLAAYHNVFADTMLEPVPLPRWLRGRRRAARDRLS